MAIDLPLGVMDTDTIKNTVIAAVREVGERIRAHLQSGEAAKIHFKGTNDIVTEIDLWAEKVIAERLTNVFPDCLIIGEESAGELEQRRGVPLEKLAQNGLCFIVDPIDGTSNFANGVPHVCVSVGALIDGVRTVGVIYDPCRDELFHAVRGQGSFLNGNAIRVGTKTKLINSLLATGFPYDREDHMSGYVPLFEKLCLSARSLRVMGSAALDQCWVACGRLDGFVEYNLKPWDAAAGSLIVEEAGGHARNFSKLDGDTYSIFARSFLYSNSTLENLLYVIAREADIIGRANTE